MYFRLSILSLLLLWLTFSCQYNASTQSKGYGDLNNSISNKVISELDKLIEYSLDSTIGKYEPIAFSVHFYRSKDTCWLELIEAIHVDTSTAIGYSFYKDKLIVFHQFKNYEGCPQLYDPIKLKTNFEALDTIKASVFDQSWFEGLGMRFVVEQNGELKLDYYGWF